MRTTTKEPYHEVDSPGARRVLGLTAASVRAQVTDAQIASIVVTANQVDIDAGKLAESKASNENAKKFAQLMITDHTGVNKQATELVTKLNVTPQDNLTSQSLQMEGEKNIAYLKTLSGAAFDKAYTVFLGSSFAAMRGDQHRGQRADLPRRRRMLLPGEDARKRLGLPHLGEVR
jgi:hypothetical protein